MHRLFSILFGCCWLCFNGPEAWAQLTLYQCFELAEERSSEVLGTREQVLAANARYTQAFASVLPTINFVVDQRYRNSIDFGRVPVPGGSSAEDPSTITGGRGGTVGKNQIEGVLRVSQPIFSGFRDFILVDAAKETIIASEHTAHRAQDVLKTAVASAFYQTLTYISDRATLRRTLDVLHQRVSELQRFRELGKARESEVLAAESELFDTQALLANTEGLLSASRELLAFFVGERGRTESLISTEDSPELAPLDDYLARSLNRSDLLAAEHQLTAQSHIARATSRQRWPAISFEGNGYVFEDPERTRDWDLLFRLNIPLFEGGAIDARRAEEESKSRALLAERDSLRRFVEQEVRSAYAELAASQSEAKVLAQLMQVSQKNFEAQKSDYELGVVTNLEVLSSIRRMHDAERRAKATELAAKLARIKLQFATGGELS